MKTIGTSLLIAAVAAGLLAAAAATAMYSGVYNVAADAPHTAAVYALLETARTRSVSRRAAELAVPSGLDDEARILQGAGNYAAMCAGCHLSPGAEPTELSRGLYPAPPNLSLKAVALGESFWVIKHGIKASGMPAWGQSMGDEYIWNMAAFVQRLPTLDAARYQALVAGSDGHAHGGGETAGHSRAAGTDAAHPAGADMPEAAPHALPSRKPASDGHSHSH